MSRIDIFTEQQKAIIAKDAPAWLEGMGVQPVAKVPEFILDTENVSMDQYELKLKVLSSNNMKIVRQIKVSLDKNGRPDFSDIDWIAGQLYDNVAGVVIARHGSKRVKEVSESLREQISDYADWLRESFKTITREFLREVDKSLTQQVADAERLAEMVREELENIRKSAENAKPCQSAGERTVVEIKPAGFSNAFQNVFSGLWNATPEVTGKLNSLSSRVFSSMLKHQEWHDTVELHSWKTFFRAMGCVIAITLYIFAETALMVVEQLFKAVPLGFSKWCVSKLPKKVNRYKKIFYRLPDSIDDGNTFYQTFQKAKGFDDFIFNEMNAMEEKARRIAVVTRWIKGKFYPEDTK